MEYAPQPTLSVSDLNRRAKMLLETQLNQVWVEGEISNLSQPGSGHWYFTLKDHNAQIRCAMFRNRNLLVKFNPKAGAKIKVRGRVSLYEPRGDYQLIAEFMEPDGEGLLQKQFDELKKKLLNEGLFAPEHKKPIPEFVSHIAVISSPTGAAVHDILTVLKRRNPGIEITLIPSLVQGEDAPQQLIRGLNLAEQLDNLDAIIIGRGGGSLEDLWAFNNEDLARKIHSSEIPVVSAVGHEVDFSISDFVADLRAPTPSAAAELISGDTDAILAHLNNLKTRCIRAVLQYLSFSRTQLTNKAKRLKHPGEKINHWQQRTDICEQRLLNAIHTKLQQKTNRIQYIQKRLSVTRPNKAISHAHTELKALHQKLNTAMHHHIERCRQQFALSAAALDIVSPLSTLNRGYAITRNDKGDILKSVTKTAPGEHLKVQLTDGEIHAKVSSITLQEDNTKGQT